MSFWLLTVFLGNFLTGTVTWLNAKLIGGSVAAEMIFYAALMLIVAGIFAAIARKFPERAADTAQ
jgi:uncharacterized membrane protein (DUF485 family)